MPDLLTDREPRARRLKGRHNQTSRGEDSAGHDCYVKSSHVADLDAGVPARGLHGEGYRGHSLAVAITHDRLGVTARPCAAHPIRIGHAGRLTELAPGHTAQVTLAR